MSYVKYTAADGTVHLCHEDSPTLMHANWYKLGAVGIGKDVIKIMTERQKKKREKMEKVSSMVGDAFNKVQDQFSDPAFIKERISTSLAATLNFKAPIEGYLFYANANGVTIQDRKGHRKAIPLDTLLTIMGINGQKLIKDIIENGDLSTVNNTLRTAATRSKGNIERTLPSLMKYSNSTYDFRERVEKKRR